MTYLQARAFGKPYVLLPACWWAAASTTPSPTTPSAACSSRPISPASGSACAPTPSPPAPGCAASSRSDYGVDLDKVEWITFEDPHVAEYRDPPIVKRAPPGKELVADAARRRARRRGGRRQAARSAAQARSFPMPTPSRASGRRRTAACRSTTWWSCARSVGQSRPDVVREVFRLLVESKRAAASPADGTPLDPLRFGVEACRPDLEIIIDYCHRAAAHPAALLGRRAVRRHHPRFESVIIGPPTRFTVAAGRSSVGKLGGLPPPRKERGSAPRSLRRH